MNFWSKWTLSKNGMGTIQNWQIMEKESTYKIQVENAKDKGVWWFPLKLCFIIVHSLLWLLPLSWYAEHEVCTKFNFCVPCY